MRWLLLEMKSKNIGLFAFFIYTVLVLVPLWLAVDRLIWIAGYDVIDWGSILRKKLCISGYLSVYTIAGIYFHYCNLSNRYTDCVATGQIQVAVRLSNPLFIDNAICNAINSCSNGIFTFNR